MMASHVNYLVSRSAAKLGYKNAQDVIDGKTLGDVPVIPEHDASAIEHDIKLLQVRPVSR
jgi:protein SSD1